MVLSLTEAAKILSISENELMFHHQSNEIQAGVNQNTLAWEFKLDDVLKLKAQLEEKEKKEKQTEEE